MAIGKILWMESSLWNTSLGLKQIRTIQNKMHDLEIKEKFDWNQLVSSKFHLL